MNEYLREISGQDFTAKDFRTWAGSVLTCVRCGSPRALTSETQAKRNVVQAIKQVAERLGNTPSVCRKCYVHPAVLERYLSGPMAAKTMKAVTEQVEQEIEDERSSHSLEQDEAALIDLLQQRLTEAKAS